MENDFDAMPGYWCWELGLRTEMKFICAADGGLSSKFGIKKGRDSGSWNNYIRLYLK
jgi:hypothetical protein